MRRLVLAAMAASVLTGCGSVSMPSLGGLTSPSPTTLQLESNPPGATAQTSTGQTCVTPCSVSVPTEPMTVTFTMDKFQPQTVSLAPAEKPATETNPGSMLSSTVMTLDPNPAYAELAPTTPPRKRRPAKRAPKRVAATAPAAVAATAAAAPAASASPFPSPTPAASPFPSR